MKDVLAKVLRVLHEFHSFGMRPTVLLCDVGGLPVFGDEANNFAHSLSLTQSDVDKFLRRIQPYVNGRSRPCQALADAPSRIMGEIPMRYRSRKRHRSPVWTWDSDALKTIAEKERGSYN